ncbi:8-oxo-dGTP diphosphatase [Chryseomicrobium aureum]|uniref:NUDIX domain-containing protein n=1 Tax=Chryseomicrobium aureum TaxID=1441723 RepID=UPI001958925F|nr:NUDIX domain-containing protein [Chryseomicrobium aureum]MBM7707224.1 8-oxo-dGTP diphosphatase [Chryseomicrobium aureum]
MQRIVNLLVIKDGKVLLLKKPRRNWYVAPGGKTDHGESVFEAGIREFTEETGTTPVNPHIKGLYTMLIKDGETVISEWLLSTLVAFDLDGVPYKENHEGVLEWHPVEALQTLPMAEGDRMNLVFAATQPGIQYGTFTYTEDFELLDYRLQTSQEVHPS